MPGFTRSIALVATCAVAGCQEHFPLPIAAEMADAATLETTAPEDASADEADITDDAGLDADVDTPDDAAQDGPATTATASDP